MIDLYVLPPGYKNFNGQIYQLVNGTWVPVPTLESGGNLK